MNFDDPKFIPPPLPKMLPLDTELVTQKCNMETWSIVEACFAANNVWPEDEATIQNLDPNTDLNVAKSIFQLYGHLNRAIISGRLNCSTGRSKRYKNAVIEYIEPQAFVEWLNRFGYEKATVLYRHYNLPIPQPPSPTIRNHATMDDVPQAVQAEVFAKYKTPGTRERWGVREFILNRAEQYMQMLIDENCRCRHDKLAANAYFNFKWYDRTLVSYDNERLQLFNAIKDVALQLVPSERRYGYHEHVGGVYIPCYDKSACHCEIPGHSEIPIPRKLKRVKV